MHVGGGFRAGVVECAQKGEDRGRATSIRFSRVGAGRSANCCVIAAWKSLLWIMLMSRASLLV